MSKIKSLIEGAHRAVEMRWTVLCYDPEKDNELVESSKLFDCICAAQAHKRELAMKHPGYIIEIVAESKKAKNESIGQEIVDEVKEEIKAELKDAIGQDVDNAIGHPATEENLGAEVKDDMEAEEDELAMEEDIDDDSDSIFAPDSLDEVITESEVDDFKTKSLGAIAILKSAGYKADSTKSNNKLISFKKGNKEVSIGLFDYGIIEVEAYDLKSYEDTYSDHWKIDKVSKSEIEAATKRAIKSFNESAQKNENDLTNSEKQLAKKLGIKVQKSLTYDEVHSPNFKPIGDHVSLSKCKDGSFEITISTTQGAWHRYGNRTYPDLKTASDVAKKNYPKYPQIVYESAQKNEAVNAAKVKQDVEKAVKDYFKNDKDALEYVYVDSKKDNQGRTIVEVRAELGYNGMTKLADHLNKVVQKHDKYAYFEQETSGIMTAVFESAQKNEDDISKYRVYSNDTKDGWSILGHYNDEHSAMQVFDAWKLRLLRGNGHYGVYTDVKLFKPGEKAKFESSQKNEADNDKFNVGDTVRVSINNIKGTIIKGLYTHNKTGKATYDIQLDDGRVIQAYKSNVKKESAQKNEFNANSEKTLIHKKQEIQKVAAKLTNDNLVQQLSLLKNYVDDAYNFALKHFDESSSDLTVAKAMARNANVSKDERVAHMIASLEKDLKNAKTDKEKKEIQEILALLKKKTKSAQINESRNWKVLVELSAPDNMNNAYVEDTVEHFLDKAGLTVFDVTATRK